MPMIGANSGMVTTFVSRVTSPKPPAPTPRDGYSYRESHGQDRAECQDQHDDGEGQPDQLGLGWFELAKRSASDFGSQTLDLWKQLIDLDADCRRLGVIDVVREVDLGERDRAVFAYLLLTERRVGADDRDACDCCDFIEDLGHRRSDVIAGDAVCGLEDDLTTKRGTRAGEIPFDGLEAAGAFGGGRFEFPIERGSDDGAESVEADDQNQPQTNDCPAVVITPAGERLIHAWTPGDERGSGCS